jgi:hypothetical protein
VRRSITRPTACLVASNGKGRLFGKSQLAPAQVWNIEGKNFLVSFSLARHLYVHGIHRYDACAKHYK